MKVDRASTNDLVMLAMGAGDHLAPCMGAVLLLAGGSPFDTDSAARLIADRVSTVPRLQQRLRRAPVGCGRPVWVDDPLFDAARHIRRRTCPGPGDEETLLQLAAAVFAEPLPPGRPLWAAVLVTGLIADKVAVIFVLHHVLADGVGGLAALHGLLDQGAGAVPAHRPRPRPPGLVLFVDAVSSRLRALSRLPAALRRIPKSVAAAGGLHPPAAASCSLLRQTGPRRQIAVARTELDRLRSAAHESGATVNDAVLAAVAGALRNLLAHRGERVDDFLITIPVSGRRTVSSTELGNDNAPLVVGIPGAGRLQGRLHRISLTVRLARAAATGPSLAAQFGPLFRVLAAWGGYRAFLRHQRRFHTVVSDLRGPDLMLSLNGSPVESMIPVSVGELGNVTVTFVALSYAGTLTIAAIADPDRTPDLSVLADALQAELDALVEPARSHS